MDSVQIFVVDNSAYNVNTATICIGTWQLLNELLVIVIQYINRYFLIIPALLTTQLYFFLNFQA